MGVTPQQFEGIETTIPGVYVKQKFPAGRGASGIVTNVVAIVGQSRAGVPYNATEAESDLERINLLTSGSQVTDVLRGGVGARMTAFYLSPSPDPNLSSPSRVYFVRVDPAVRATAQLKDSGANNIINISSTRYGALANQISRFVEAGTVFGHKVTVKFQGVTVGERDNVGFNHFSLQYVGAGSAATMTINTTQLTTSVTGGPGGEDLNLLFADFPTVDVLVNYINNQTPYTATLLGSSDAKTNLFDAVTAQDIATAAYTVLGNVEALIQFLNRETGGEIVASLTPAAVRTDVVNDAGYVFLTGGSDGTTTSADWAGAFSLLEKLEVNDIRMATDSPALHAIGKAHVEKMSQIGQKKNRSLGVGSNLTNTKAQRISEAKALNSARSEYWATPFWRSDPFDPTSGIQEWAPFYGAAFGAGIRFGNAITISATGKLVEAVKVSESYSSTDLEDYIRAGITVMRPTTAGIEVVRNVSTYQSGASLILNEPSMLRNADFVSLDFIAQMVRRIKSLNAAPNDATISQLKNYIIVNLLPGYRDAGLLTEVRRDGVVIQKAFDDVEFNLFADRFEVNFSGTVPAPLNFVFSIQNFHTVGSI